MYASKIEKAQFSTRIILALWAGQGLSRQLHYSPTRTTPLATKKATKTGFRGRFVFREKIVS
jgi:hypothetical protein